MGILTDIYNGEYHPQATRPVMPQDLREKIWHFGRKFLKPWEANT